MEATKVTRPMSAKNAASWKTKRNNKPTAT